MTGGVTVPAVVPAVAPAAMSLTGAAEATGPDPWVYLVAALTVVVGAALQRASGTGFGLVVGPTIAVLLGPSTSVLFVNAVGILVAAIILPAVWRQIDWRRAAGVVGWGIPGSALGAWALHSVPPAVLTLAIGVIVLAGLGVIFALRELPHWEGPGTTAVAGALAGLFNAGSGIPAPVLVAYARLSRWEHHSFVATLQPIFIGLPALALVGRFGVEALLGPGAGAAGAGADAGAGAAAGAGLLPPWWAGLLLVAAALAGLVAGNGLARRLEPRRAQQLTIVLAVLGGVAALVRGGWELLA